MQIILIFIKKITLRSSSSSSPPLKSLLNQIEPRTSLEVPLSNCVLTTSSFIQFVNYKKGCTRLATASNTVY